MILLRCRILTALFALAWVLAWPKPSWGQVACLDLFTSSPTATVLEAIEMSPTFRGEEHGESLGKESARVLYLETATERAPYEWTIRDGLLIKNVNGHLVPLTTHENVSTSLLMEFIATTSGRLYGMTYLEQGLASNAAQAGIHHSTFLAGGAVGFAGNMRVENGRIVEIDNLSGHYMPRPQAMLSFLEYLGSRGVDLSDAKIDISGFKRVIAEDPVFFERILKFMPEWAVLREQIRMAMSGQPHVIDPAYRLSVTQRVEQEFKTQGRSPFLNRHFWIWKEVRNKEIKAFFQELARAHGVQAPP